MLIGGTFSFFSYNTGSVYIGSIIALFPIFGEDAIFEAQHVISGLVTEKRVLHFAL
jgi:hypothetical protein